MRCKWFLSQVGKAIDCNSMTAGSNPAGTSSNNLNAPLAQLDRVSDYESGGYEFDSCEARQMKIMAEKSVFYFKRPQRTSDRQMRRKQQFKLPRYHPLLIILFLYFILK